jgi:gamma-glutamyltranspeptidase/glutathione hydrolase
MIVQRVTAVVVAWCLIGWVALTPAHAETRFGVASAHPLATQAGEAVLARGGNAFDAAVAVAAALAVVEPFSSGLGGGGFFLLHRAADGRDVVIDARETAPGAASRDMYLDAKGEPDSRASLDGARAAAIPGLVAGLDHLASRYGTRPVAELLAPAARCRTRGSLCVRPASRRRCVRSLRAAGMASTPVRSRARWCDRCAPPAASGPRRTSPTTA